MISLLLASLFTLIELNCENLFDTRHDSLKNDTEFLPEGSHHWTRTRYWHKLNDIGREIIALGEDSAGWRLPDVVAMCEVENDSVMYDLTRRSLLRKARYEYLMTDSPDERGIDVALMYNPVTFRPLFHHALRVPLLPDMRPTRDILYVAGVAGTADTLHLLVVHAPSRMGGERASRPFRLQVARRLIAAIDSIRLLQPDAQILRAISTTMPVLPPSTVSTCTACTMFRPRPEAPTGPGALTASGANGARSTRLSVAFL